MPGENNSRVYEFGAFKLNPAECLLLRDGRPLPLAPKAFETLVALVERAGRLVEKDELLKVVWADAFVEEANLARCVHTLRKALGEESGGTKYIETVPKRGYRFVAEVREASDVVGEPGTIPVEGLPAAAADAPLRRMVPGGAGAEVGESRLLPAGGDTADPAAPPPGPGGGGEPLASRAAVSVAARASRRRLAAAAVTATLLLAASVPTYFFLFRRGESGSRAAVESIAVLPFTNEGGDQDTEYLSDGITDTLITSLSRIPELRVMSRNSVFRYKGKEADAVAVGDKLGVEAVLVGSVSQRGDDLTVSVELVDARDNRHLWGAQYSRGLADVLTVQGDIARDVSQKLRARLSGAAERRVTRNYTENTEAYRLYLRGRFHARKHTPRDARKAVEYYEAAVAVDPNYALAYAGLADAYAPLSDWSDVPPRDLILKAKEYVLKALSLDDQLAEAHTALGFILHYDYDFAGAEREFRRALELNPADAPAHMAYGDLLTHLGRREEGFAELRRALELDPLSPGFNRMYGESLFFARRYDEAVAKLKDTLELDPDYWLTHYSLAITYQVQGDYAGSVAERARINDLVGTPQAAAFIRESFAEGGWQGFLRAMTSDRRPPGIPAYVVATFHAELGERDKAFAILRELYEGRSGIMVLLKVDPRLDPLRGDPRFAELLRVIGFPQ